MPRNKLPPGPGRPKGLKNKATVEIQAFSREILGDPVYQASLRERLAAGKAPHMETLLHHYAYGQPVKRVELSATVDDRREGYRKMTDNDIQARALELTTQLNGKSVH